MWTDLVAWFQSAAGMRLLDGAIVPFIAIVVAGLVAGLVVRGAVRGLLLRAQRDTATTAVIAVAEAARRAATADRRSPADRLEDDEFTAQAALRLRLLPLPGADLAADWSTAAIDQLRTAGARDGGAVRSGAAELDVIRDRLVRWLRAPRQARRLFPRPTVRRPTVPRSLVQRSTTSRPTPAAGPGAKRDRRRRSSAVDIPVGAVESASLPISGPTSPDALAPAQQTEKPAVAADATARTPAPQPGNATDSPIEDIGAERPLVEAEATGTSPVPIARHVAPASANPPAAGQPDVEPLIDNRSSRQADEDDDADFMRGSDQQGPPPVTAIPLRETAPAHP